MNDSSNTTNDKKAFKDWFDRSAAQALAEQMLRGDPDFPVETFVDEASRDLASLEMQGRVKQFSGALEHALSGDLLQRMQVIERSLPAILPDCEAVTDGWLQWPVGQWIAEHCLPEPEAALELMVKFTQRFSAEFAIRPFVEQMPEWILPRLLKLCSHPSAHVRRLCSEGIRPRLPWGKKLKALEADPEPLFPIIAALKDDPERYVQRSVANLLNDISKCHPERVIQELEGWKASEGSSQRWIQRHALRSLLKDGHPGALALEGFAPPNQIDAKLKLGVSELSIGEKLPLHARLHNRSRQRQQLMLDLEVGYLGARGQSRAKVFKWTTLELTPGESRELEKKLPFVITTVRKLYPGSHRMTLLLNGKRMGTESFELR